ncbi:UNVERIFIED_CONTAM: Inner membrane protein PPF-1, chloroplastic [Sesamum angustifolium]|uniref:Inner membrane protein PPF-1, chloroplastic n=1 Tax=Sesamum angustifolium TaxID=2727405 RepID=A0AAW2QPZ3_9LAMI
MARTLISSPAFLGTPLPSLSRHGFLPQGRPISTRVKFSLHHLPPVHHSVDFNAIIERAESLLYTLADAAVVADGGVGASGSPAAQKSGGWFGFISDAMEVVLKVNGDSSFMVLFLDYLDDELCIYMYSIEGVFIELIESEQTPSMVLKDGLATVHVPYAYGFAIILLTVLVKVATFPLTKQQVESTLAMQNLQPKIKAIQERYAGNQERIQLETSRLYRQAGVNPLAGAEIVWQKLYLFLADHVICGWMFSNVGHNTSLDRLISSSFKCGKRGRPSTTRLAGHCSIPCFACSSCSITICVKIMKPPQFFEHYEEREMKRKVWLMTAMGIWETQGEEWEAVSCPRDGGRGARHDREGGEGVGVGVRLGKLVGEGEKEGRRRDLRW